MATTEQTEQTEQTERPASAPGGDAPDLPDRRPAEPIAVADGAATVVPVSRRLVAALVGLVLLPVLGALTTAVTTTWYPASDLAIIEAHTMDIPSHPPLVGVFSRFNFHHPGPAMFYVYALPQRLLGPTGLLVGAALINAVAAVAIVLCLRRRGGRSLLLLGTGALLVLEVALAPYLAHPWNAYVPILPFALAILLAWGVWERDWWALPLLVATVSFTVQTHLGYALVGLWLLGPATAWALWVGISARRAGGSAPGGPAWRVWLVAGAAGAVLWLPPLIDQLTRPPGNLRLLVGHFTGDQGPVVGWGGAVGIYARELGVAPPWLLLPEPVQPFIGGTEPGPLWWLLPTIAAFAAATWWAWRRRRGAALRLLALVGGTTALGFVSVARITGDAFPYIIRWLWVLGVLLWLAIAWAVRPTRLGATARRSLAVVAAVAMLALGLGGAVRAHQTPLPDAVLSQAIAAVVGPTADATRGRPNLLMLPEGGSWQEVQAGLLVELERRGVFLMVRDEDAFLYGDQRTIHGRPVEGRVVVAVNEGVIARRQKGSVPIAEFDPLSPAERTRLASFVGRWSAGLDAVQAGRPVPDPLTPDESAQFAELQGRGQLVAVYLDEGPLSGPSSVGPGTPP